MLIGMCSAECLQQQGCSAPRDIRILQDAQPSEGGSSRDRSAAKRAKTKKFIQSPFNIEKVSRYNSPSLCMSLGYLLSFPFRIDPYRLLVALLPRSLSS